MPIPPERSHCDRYRDLIAGADLTRELDAVFVNAPLRDYTRRPRVNDFTLPVLGMGYIATYAAAQGYNIGVLDAEAHGLGIDHTSRLINAFAPRWVGFNLLAPTYQISAQLAASLDPGIKIMLGGHHAKAIVIARFRRFCGHIHTAVSRASSAPWRDVRMIRRSARPRECLRFRCSGHRRGKAAVVRDWLGRGRVRH